MPPKVQAQMSAKYKNLSATTRMKRACEAVMAGEFNQSEAARQFGVTRSKLNEHVQKAKAVLAEQAERADDANARRRGETVPVEPEQLDIPNIGAGPLGLREKRRVPGFIEFDQIYFGGLQCFDCGKHHETPPFHHEMMENLEDPSVKRLLINMPPGHSKSTISTIKHTVHEKVKDPNHMTGVVSAGRGLTDDFMYSIGRYLTDHSLYEGSSRNLIEDWGPFQDGSAPWNKDKIYISGRTSHEKDASVMVFGYGSRIYGHRMHEIICDDLADLENQRNPDRVAEMMRWIMQEPDSRMGKNGKLIFVGTRVHAGDIYSHLQQLPGYKVLRYPCIVDETDQVTLWPDHFGFVDAELKRNSMPAEQWQLVYQNIDIPGFGASFPPEIVEGTRNPERSFGQHDNWALIIGLDPAGAGEQAGYTALVLLGVDMTTGKRYVVDMVRAKQLKAPQLRDQLFDWADRYYPYLRELRVESNGLQSQLVQYNEEIIRYMTNKGVRVVPHITHGRNKWDAEFGVEAMAPMFYNKMIELPFGDHATRNRIRALEEELIAFPMGRTSDLVMALWFAELGAKEMIQRQMLPMFDGRRRVPNRIAKRRRVVNFGDRTVKAPTEEMFEWTRPMFQNGKIPTKHKLQNVGGEITVY